MVFSEYMFANRDYCKYVYYAWNIWHVKIYLQWPNIYGKYGLGWQWQMLRNTWTVRCSLNQFTWFNPKIAPPWILNQVRFRFAIMADTCVFCNYNTKISIKAYRGRRMLSGDAYTSERVVEDQVIRSYRQWRPPWNIVCPHPVVTGSGMKRTELIETACPMMTSS